ncbi:transcription elongation factor NusA [Pyrococcus sp. NA2]|uniref:transcription elongation factor NusA n=1 Tax=Pyrococcus sp. (strain NA2) TaxID=342949 RepID=UPI000209AAEA|nr:transcription elongation factor NusA [Pyrococcus sp. NA2]AEC52012.1 transcription elongation factor NusA [Pyrococcus sp. NA2]
MDDIYKRLREMLRVEIIDLEFQEDKIIVYVPKDQVRLAVGYGGSVVKSAELVLGRKIEVRGR